MTDKFSFEDTINILVETNNILSGESHEPIFTSERLFLISRVIFMKNSASLFGAFIDYLKQQEEIHLVFSPSQMRKLKFLDYYFNKNLNAAAAARHAGYSVKSAKQQGYRTLKEIQALLHVNKSKQELFS